MWLLNHSSARKFEVPMLKALGFNEIFLPKKYPCDPRFRSASIDFSQDEFLTIPKEDLAFLNEQDWYRSPSKEVWDIVNQHFKAIFFIILDDSNLLKSIAKYYDGIAIWRTYGLDKSLSYTRILELTKLTKYAKALGHRFVFGQAYQHLHEIEDVFLSSRKLNLPAGLDNCQVNDLWSGINKKIYFVCPDIGFNVYYQQVYHDFRADFGDFPHVIAGSQPIRVSDANILGFVSKEEHEQNMREMRLMYYHSQEPNHIHYHPFEAIRAGMPLVFMAGGILDKFGGTKLPGRCKNIKEARKKIKRILNDDWQLIHAIKNSQHQLLEAMRFENCLKDWQASFHAIRSLLAIPSTKKEKKIRIAVFQADRSSRQTLTTYLFIDSLFKANKTVEVVYAHQGRLPNAHRHHIVSSSLHHREFHWKKLDNVTARTALNYARGLQFLPYPNYFIPDDGINHFMDCDLWVFFAENIQYPILPIKPNILAITQFSQDNKLEKLGIFDSNIIHACHEAEAIITISPQIKKSLEDLHGFASKKILSFPICSEFERPTSLKKILLWLYQPEETSNVQAFTALITYYQSLNGEYECYIYGLNAGEMGKFDSTIKTFLKHNPKVYLRSDHEDFDIYKILREVAFVWYPYTHRQHWPIVLTAAKSNIPVLVASHLEFKMLAEQYSLKISWITNIDSALMAQQLKNEENRVLESIKPPLDNLDIVSKSDLKNYWEKIEECL